MEKVAVLMSTYNGEQFLREQLDSILDQENVDLNLYVRDDGSNDHTIDILSEYADKHSNVHFYRGDKNLGACGSFLELLSKEYDADYFALADQDDIWDKDKISVAIEKLKTLPADKPALYHSNLRIVDQDGRYVRESHSKPLVAGAKYSFLADVFVTGCTAVFNKKLQEIAVRVKPEHFSMHDTWLYTVVSMFGNCIYDFDSHISYRQHSANVIGTSKKKISAARIKREISRYFNRDLQPRLLNAKELLVQFDGDMDAETRKKVEKVANYKKSIPSTISLALDKDLRSENAYRALRFSIKALLRNI